MTYENHVLDTSKFTLNAIGIIAQNKTMNLKKIRKIFQFKPFKTASKRDTKNIITNKYLFAVFNSSSKIPIFNLGVEEFILALVSFPV